MLSFKEEVLKMKLQSVEEFFHKRETVEKYNVAASVCILE